MQISAGFASICISETAGPISSNTEYIDEVMPSLELFIDPPCHRPGNYIHIPSLSNSNTSLIFVYINIRHATVLYEHVRCHLNNNSIIYYEIKEEIGYIVAHPQKFADLHLVMLNRHVQAGPLQTQEIV